MRATLCVLALALALSMVSAAQTTSSQSQNGASQQSTASGGEAEQKMAAASKEAANPEHKDQNAQFKESPSVHWLSEKLHVSMPAANWISIAINFLVLAWLVDLVFRRKGLQFMGMPALPAARRDFSENIRKQMEDAQRASEDANRRLHEIEGKLAQIGSEIAEFEAQAATQQRNEEAALKSAIEEERQRILATAKQEIESASANALRQLRAHAAELAISLAEKKIQVDGATDQVLVRDFVNQLGKDGQ